MKANWQVLTESNRWLSQMPSRAEMMKLQCKPFSINIIQVYARTQYHKGEQVEEFYEE